MNTFRLPTLEGIHPHRFGLVSWTPHVAFAFDLVADLRPQMLVELGTHSGESYFAFCQSAQENHVGTTCYAVDTWKGDPQAGFYPEDVYADVFRYNQEHYANFSYLVRATFDEAVEKFADGSVDLIHFDGLHTYEAVKHDLERWQTKLSPRGVAIFHDIAARHDDFGAWKLWEEICHEGQSFAFRHGWGLGIWKPAGGEPTGSRLLEILFAADEAEAENIRRYYILATDALRSQKAATENLRLEESLKAAMLRTEGLREEIDRRDEALRDAAQLRDEALRVQTVLRAEALQHDEAIRQTHAEREEALRVQTVLRDEARQRDDALRQIHAEREEALRVQSVLRDEAKQRDESMRQMQIEREEALRVQTVLREDASQREEVLRLMRLMQAEREEALRAQTALREEARQRDDALRQANAELAARQANDPKPQALQIYFSRDGIFEESDSVAFPLTPGEWQRITVPLPTGWRGGSLRLDPGDGFGLADVAGMTVRTTLLGEEVWKLVGGALKHAAVLAGSARLVPGARNLRVLCAESDPQILLPNIELGDFDEPLTLEIGIRLRRDLPGMRQVFQEVAAKMVEWPAIQARTRELAARLAESYEAHGFAQTELARVHEALAARTAELATAREEWSEASRRQQTEQTEQHAKQLRSLQDAMHDGESKLLDTEAELQELHSEQEAERQEGKAFGEEIAGLQAEIYAVNVRLADKDQSLAETHARSMEIDRQLAAALVRGEADHNRLRSMRRSASWKLTLPLRVVSRFLTGKKPNKTTGPLVPDLIVAAPAPTPASGGYRFQLDEPANWNLPSRHVGVRGWCLPPLSSDAALPLLRFRCGDLQTEVPCTVARDDVQTAHGGHPGWRRCGFEAKIELPRGPSEVVIEALDAQGRAWPVGRFSARAPYADRFRLPPGGDPAHDYPAWVARYDSFSSEDRRRLRKKARALPSRPVISVVMPVYNTPRQWLVKAIDSIRRQFYPFWEFCIADDNSPAPHVKEILRRYEQIDSRIKVVYRTQNGHISEASNSALAIATGEFVVLLDHDDELAPHALYMIAERLNEQPALQMIYSDEDKIDPGGQRRDPYFKPDWNYDLFLGQNVFSHLGAYRRDLLTKIGGFQVGLEGSQDYDLALRCLEQVEPEEIGHIRHILYHWRMIPGSTSVGGDEKPYAREAARRAIGQHLERLGQGATVEQNPWLADFHRVRRSLPTPPPEVAIIIPTRDGVDVLRVCVESILERTDYPSYRIVVVDNGSIQPATFDYFQECRERIHHRFEVLDYPGEFNFSAINNFAVRATDAPLVCLLNNDIEVLDAGWLTELASQAMRPDVGAAGARLVYPDGTLQHAGIIIGLGADRTAGHAHHRLPGAAFGHFGRAKLIQQFSAVTAACMVLRRETFEEVGGFDEKDFPVGLNDVDLCLRLRERGYLIIWTPFAELRHHESYSRGIPVEGTPTAERARREVANFRQRHRHFVEHDPAYNPNLTLDHSDFSLALPPRSPKP